MISPNETVQAHPTPEVSDMPSTLSPPRDGTITKGANGEADPLGNRETGPPPSSTVASFVASLPARFRPPKPLSGEEDRKVDASVAQVVRRWLELKETRGLVITEDLRTRAWYKSPDMMMSMLTTFGIDDRGTLLSQVGDVRNLKTRTEARALWAEYEERRSKERSNERKRAVEKAAREASAAESALPAAVQAAMLKAREHAAKAAKHGSGGGEGKRQKKK